MTKAGFNISVLKKAASHGIHSITVKDIRIRYYFDTSFPKKNYIPTVNSKLDGKDLVLPSAPFGSEFETPGMGIMDRVLSNDDGSDNFMIQAKLYIPRTIKTKKYLHSKSKLDLLLTFECRRYN